jgi:zinc protease
MMQRITLVSLSCLLAILSIAQSPKALPVDPAIRIGKLPNGLTYYIRKNAEPEKRAELRLVVNAGSVLESDKQTGLAHFVEHMSFNGTRHFQKNELVNFLEKSGVNFGADLNAYTSFDETVYELQVPTDSAAVYTKAFQILEDWAHLVSFEPAEIDKERGVIVEEWRLGRGAEARLRDKYFPILLKGSRYASRLPIGTKANIDTAHYNQIISFYKDWYRPDLQAVIVVGDVDIDATEALIKQHFASIPAAVNPKKREKFSIPSHTDTRMAILTDPEQPYNVVQIFYTRPEAPVVKTEEQYRADLVRDLFNQMMSSRLDEIAQKPDAPFLFGSSSYGSFMGNLDAFSLIAVAKTGKDIKKSVQILLTENERVKRYGFTATELERAKANMLSRIENMFNERDKTKSAELVEELVRNYLKGEAIPGIAYEYRLYQQFLPGIALTEVNALIAQWIRNTDRSVVITAPDKEKTSLPAKEAILAQLNQPAPAVKPYIDKVSSAPLLPVDPQPGKVIAKKTWPAVGAEEWTLSNGARVILKPTDFKNDDIQFSAISWGGTSLYSNEEFVNASNAASVASIGGIGTMDIQALQKALAGKNCFSSASIANYMQGVNGFSTKKDLSTALQLLHGSFTAVRKDPEMFEVLKQQIKVQLENKDKDPGSVFSDSVSYIMGNYHPRRKPFTVEDLAKLNQDKALAIFKERFKNAGQFQFTFVGSFSPDSLQPLVEKYIASLPGTAEKEQYKDPGLRYPDSRISKTIYKGRENKASVRLFFTGMLNEYAEMDDIQLGQLCKALSIRLREILREDAGGVYGVGVNGGIAREPVNSYSIGIQFGCAPENVEKLIALVLEEINHVKADGIAQENLDKVIAEQLRSLENDVKENSYWRYQLEQAFFRGNDPVRINEAPKRIKQITVARTKALANTFFNDDRFIRIVLLPEGKNN